MVFAVETVANVAQPHHTRNVLQLAITVSRTSQAVKRMIGNIEFHDIASQLRQLIGLRADLHALFDRGGAGRRIALATFNLDQAHATRAEWFEVVCRAKFRYIDPVFARRTQDA